jgi:hypothetical protein
MGWIFTIRTNPSILGVKGAIVYGVGIYGVERSWFASPLHAISTVGVEETKLSSGEGNKYSCSALGDNVLDDVDYLIPFISEGQGKLWLFVVCSTFALPAS